MATLSSFSPGSRAGNSAKSAPVHRQIRRTAPTLVNSTSNLTFDVLAMRLPQHLGITVATGSGNSARRAVALVVMAAVHLCAYAAIQNNRNHLAAVEIKESAPYLSYIAPQAAVTVAPPFIKTAKAVTTPTQNADVREPTRQSNLTVENPVVTNAPKQADSPALPAPAAVPTIMTSVAPLPTQVVATPKTVSSGIEYLQAPQPMYSPLAKRAGEQGKVLLRVLVNEAGVPEQVLIELSSGYARLDEAARVAVLRARFKPHFEEGKSVAMYALVPISFVLDQ